MPKLWDLMSTEAKTRVMALRHYLAKKENNKEGKTMRKDGNKLVFEEKDLNTVLAYGIRDYQYTNKNEMPEVVVIQVPACVTGKDRNGIEYAVGIETVRIDPPELRERKEEDLKRMNELTKSLHKPAPKKAAKPVDEHTPYMCPKCGVHHQPGSRVHKRHLKLVT